MAQMREDMDVEEDVDVDEDINQHPFKYTQQDLDEDMDVDIHECSNTDINAAIINHEAVMLNLSVRGTISACYHQLKSVDDKLVEVNKIKQKKESRRMSKVENNRVGSKSEGDDWDDDDNSTGSENEILSGYIIDANELRALKKDAMKSSDSRADSRERVRKVYEDQLVTVEPVAAGANEG
ncbi:MAG: hypothetical protein Q9188_006581 [Gyalolechia gomerana]